MSRKDIILNEDFDLTITKGDFGVNNSDQQHVQAIFTAHKGEFKEWPLVGFGASKYLKKSKVSKPEFLRDLKVQLNYDGYDNPKIDIDNGIEKLIIEV